MPTKSLKKTSDLEVEPEEVELSIDEMIKKYHKSEGANKSKPILKKKRKKSVVPELPKSELEVNNSREKIPLENKISSDEFTPPNKPRRRKSVIIDEIPAENLAKLEEISIGGISFLIQEPDQDLENFKSSENADFQNSLVSEDLEIKSTKIYESNENENAKTDSVIIKKKRIKKPENINEISVGVNENTVSVEENITPKRKSKRRKKVILETDVKSLDESVIEKNEERQIIIDEKNTKKSQKITQEV